jgi:hypothetical protein
VSGPRGGVHSAQLKTSMRPRLRGAGPIPDWPTMLASACAGEGLSSAFQPIVDVPRGLVVGYEALARFDHQPALRPDAWFAAAHEHGRRPELEAAALRSGLQARDALPPNCFLSINVSPDLLAHERVRAVWQEHRDLAGVVVELTERAPIESCRRRSVAIVARGVPASAASRPARRPGQRADRAPRLCAMTASASHAALAKEFPEGRWARPADFSSAMDCSTAA